MITDCQMEGLEQLFIFSGAGGVLWMLVHVVSLAFRRHRLVFRFAAMSLIACAWVLLLWPITGRHSENLPLVFTIMPWWAAICVGNLIEWRRGKSPAAVPPATNKESAGT